MIKKNNQKKMKFIKQTNQIKKINNEEKLKILNNNKENN